MKSEQIYMRAQEVADELGVSVAYAYKVNTPLPDGHLNRPSQTP